MSPLLLHVPREWNQALGAYRVQMFGLYFPALINQGVKGLEVLLPPGTQQVRCAVPVGHHGIRWVTLNGLPLLGTIEKFVQ